MSDTTNTSASERGGSGLWDKLVSGAHSAVELRIVTIVSDVRVEGDLSAPKVTIPSDTRDAIATSINLAAGDITSAVPERLWAPEHQVIRDYHQRQVDMGAAIVERNLRLIGEVGSALAKALHDLRSLDARGT